MNKERWLEAVEGLAHALEQTGVCAPGISEASVQQELLSLPSSCDFQDLQLPQLLRAALAHDCSTVLQTAVMDRVASLLSVQSQQQCPHTADPLASPTAVSSLLSCLLEPSQGPVAQASRRVVAQAVLGGQQGSGSDYPGLAQLQQDSAWDQVPSLEDLYAAVSREQDWQAQQHAPSSISSFLGQQGRGAGEVLAFRGEADTGFDALSLEGSVEDLMQVYGEAQDNEEALASDDERQLFDQQHKGSVQQAGADVMRFSSGGSGSGSEPGCEMVGEGGAGFGGSSHRSSGSGSWEGGGFNAGAVKRCVARLADPSQRLHALHALAGSDSKAAAAQGGLSHLLGIHPEDIVFSPAWPALCAALPACLMGPSHPHPHHHQHDTAPGSPNSPAAATASPDTQPATLKGVPGVDAREHTVVHGGVLWPPAEGSAVRQGGEGTHSEVDAGTAPYTGGGLESTVTGGQEREQGAGAAAAQVVGQDVLCMAAVLVEQLAKQCVATSPLHAAQLLQALMPFVLAGPVCGEGGTSLQGPVNSVASSALSLLRSLAQDWHFLPPQVQAHTAQTVSSLLTACICTNMHSCHAALCPSSSSAAAAVATPPATQSELARQSPALHHSPMPLQLSRAAAEQRSTSTSTSSRSSSCPLQRLGQLDPGLRWLQRLASTSSSTPSVCEAAATPAHTCTTSPAPAAPGGAERHPDAADGKHRLSLLQLLMRGLEARRELRHKQPQCGSQGTPLSNHCVPAIACALLLLPERVWHHTAGAHTAGLSTHAQLSLQQHVTGLLVEEAAQVCAGWRVGTREPPLWVSVGLLPVASLSTQLFSACDSLDSLLAACMSVLAASGTARASSSAQPLSTSCAGSRPLGHSRAVPAAFTEDQEQLLSTAAALCSQLADSQQGADALLRCHASCSEGSRCTPMLIGCAQEAVRCQMLLLQTGSPPAHPPACLLPPCVWRLVEAAGTACSHATAPLLVMQQGMHGLLQSLVLLVDQACTSSHHQHHQQQRQQQQGSSSGPTPEHAACSAACDALLSLCHSSSCAAVAAPLLGSHPTAARVCAHRILHRLQSISSGCPTPPPSSSGACPTASMPNQAACTARLDPAARLLQQRPLLAAASHLALCGPMQRVLVEVGVVHQVVLHDLGSSLLGLELPLPEPALPHEDAGAQRCAKTAPPPSAAAERSGGFEQAPASPSRALSSLAPLSSLPSLSSAPASSSGLRRVASQPSSRSLLSTSSNTQGDRLLAQQQRIQQHHHQQLQQQHYHHQEQQQQQHTRKPAPVASHPLMPSRPDALTCALHSHPSDCPLLLALRAAQAVLAWHGLPACLGTRAGVQLVGGLVGWLGAAPGTDLTTGAAWGGTLPGRPSQSQRGASAGDAGSLSHAAACGSAAAAHGAVNGCGQDVAHVALRCLLMWLQDAAALKHLGATTDVCARLARVVEGAGVEVVGPWPAAADEVGAAVTGAGIACEGNPQKLVLPVDMNVGPGLLLLSRTLPAAVERAAASPTAQPLQSAGRCLPPPHPTPSSSNSSSRSSTCDAIQGWAASALHAATTASPSGVPGSRAQSTTPPDAPSRPSVLGSLLQESMAQSCSAACTTSHAQTPASSAGCSASGAHTPVPRSPVPSQAASSHREQQHKEQGSRASTPPQQPPTPWPQVSHRLVVLVSQLVSQANSTTSAKHTALPSQAAVQAVQSVLSALSYELSSSSGSTHAHSPDQQCTPSSLQQPTQSTPHPHPLLTPTAGAAHAPMHVGLCPDLELPLCASELTSATAQSAHLPLLHHPSVVQAAEHVQELQATGAAGGLSHPFVLADARGVVHAGGGKALSENAVEPSSCTNHKQQQQQYTSSTCASSQMDVHSVAALARLLDAVWACLGQQEYSSSSNTQRRSSTGAGAHAQPQQGRTCAQPVRADATSTLVVVLGCLMGLAGMEDSQQHDGLQQHERKTVAPALLPQGPLPSRVQREQRANVATVRLLQQIADCPAGVWLWPALGQCAHSGCGAVGGGGGGGVHVMAADSAHCGLAAALAWVLQHCEPQLHAALCGCAGDSLALASLLHIAQRWVAGGGAAVGGGVTGLAFSGWLPACEVVKLLVLQLARGPDYLVYSTAAVIKHLEPALMEASAQGSVEPFLATCQFTEISLEQHLGYMTELAARCRPLGLLSFLVWLCCAFKC